MPKGTIQLQFSRGPLLRSGRRPSNKEPRLFRPKNRWHGASEGIAERQAGRESTCPAILPTLVRRHVHEAEPQGTCVARELIERHGRTKLHGLLPLVVKRLKDDWPDAKTFSAIARYLPEVNAEHERKQAAIQREKERNLQEQMSRRRQERSRDEQRKLVAQWRPAWEALSGDDRQRIEETVRTKWPYVARLPGMFERYCIMELAQRPGGEIAG